MIGKVRRTRLLDRAAQPFARRRDVHLVVVATEDTYAARQYLDALQSRGLVDRSRVEIVSLPTTSGRSTIRDLLDRLSAHQGALDVRLATDEYWAVFDVDQQPTRALAEAAQIARARAFRLAGSDPCFELWLLLHLTSDLSGIPSAVEDRGAARVCERRLHEALQAGDPRARGYDKARIGADRFAVPERVREACARARQTSRDDAPWPQVVGTHVHLLIERLPSMDLGSS